MPVSPPPVPPAPIVDMSRRARWVLRAAQHPRGLGLAVACGVLLLGAWPSFELAMRLPLPARPVPAETQTKAPPAARAVVTPSPLPPPAPPDPQIAVRAAAIAAEVAEADARKRYDAAEAGIALEEGKHYAEGARLLERAAEQASAAPEEAAKTYAAAAHTFGRVASPPVALGLGEARSALLLAARSFQERFVLAGAELATCEAFTRIESALQRARALAVEQSWEQAKAIYAGAQQGLADCIPARPAALDEATRAVASAEKAAQRRFARVAAKLEDAVGYAEARDLRKTAEDDEATGRYLDAVRTYGRLVEVLDDLEAPPPPDKAPPEPDPTPAPTKSMKRDAPVKSSPDTAKAAKPYAAIKAAEAAAGVARERFARADRVAQRNPQYLHANEVLKQAQAKLGNQDYAAALALATQAQALFEQAGPEGWQAPQVTTVPLQTR